MSDDNEYVNIRHHELLGPAIGAKIVDVSQHDEEEFKQTGESKIYLHLDNGMTLAFPVGDEGFEIMDHPSAESE